MLIKAMSSTLEGDGHLVCGCLERYLLLEARSRSSNPLGEKRKDPSMSVCLYVCMFEQGFSRLGLELETVLLLQLPKCTGIRSVSHHA